MVMPPLVAEHPEAFVTFTVTICPFSKVEVEYVVEAPF
jgi:hypothetical protein